MAALQDLHSAFHFYFRECDPHSVCVCVYQCRRFKRHGFDHSSLVWEDLLDKGTATTPVSIIAWRIPWTKEPGGLQFIPNWNSSKPIKQKLYNPTPLHSLGTTVLLFVSMNLTIKIFLTIQVPYISEIIQYLSFCHPIFLIHLTFITFKMTDILQGPR